MSDPEPLPEHHIEAGDAMDYLQRESHHFDDVMRDQLSRLERLVLFGITSLGVAASVVVSYSHWALALGIPWLGLLLWALAMASLNEVFVLAAARSLIDEQIELFGRSSEPRLKLVGWEKVPTRFTTHSSVQAYVLVTGGTVVTFIFSALFVAAWQHLPSWHILITLELIAFGISSSVAFVLSLRLLSVYDRARSAIVEAQR